jgi:hypothetical protein
MPDDTSTHDSGQIDPVGETAAVFLIGQDIDWQGEMTLEKHRDETMLAKGADQPIEGHWGDTADGCRPLQAESTVGGDKGLPRQFGTHTAIAQDEVGQHCKDSLARGTLHAPDGEAAEANPRIMGVAGETAAVTQGFVIELEAKSQEKGQNEVNERFAIAQQLKVGGFIVKIDGEGTVLAGRFGALSHVSSSVEMAVGADEISCG